MQKFRFKLKKVGKTTRPFRYELNQNTYDNTVEVINRFKGLDLVERVPEELWTQVHNTVQESGTTREALSVTKIIQRKRERDKGMQESKVFV